MGDKAAAAAKSSPEGKLGRETILGDKAAAAAKSSPEGKLGRETSLGDKAAAAANNSPEGKSGTLLARPGETGCGALHTFVVRNGTYQEGRQAWETRRQRQPRAAQKGNHEGRQAWETRRQRHHDHPAISELSNPVIEK